MVNLPTTSARTETSQSALMICPEQFGTIVQYSRALEYTNLLTMFNKTMVVTNSSKLRILSTTTTQPPSQVAGALSGRPPFDRSRSSSGDEVDAERQLLHITLADPTCLPRGVINFASKCCSAAADAKCCNLAAALPFDSSGPNASPMLFLFCCPL